MWSKEYPEFTTNAISLIGISNGKQRVTVIGADANKIIDILNEFEALKQCLDFEYKLAKKATNDQDLDTETRKKFDDIIEFLQILRLKHESLVHKRQWEIS